MPEAVTQTLEKNGTSKLVVMITRTQVEYPFSTRDMLAFHVNITVHNSEGMTLKLTNINLLMYYKKD
jgi:hypothetical protein